MEGEWYHSSCENSIANGLICDNAWDTQISNIYEKNFAYSDDKEISSGNINENEHQNQNQNQNKIKFM